MAVERQKKKQPTTQGNILLEPVMQNLMEDWGVQLRRLKKRFKLFRGARVIGETEGIEGKLGSLGRKIEEMGAVKKDGYSILRHSRDYITPDRRLQIEIADTGSGAHIMVIEEKNQKHDHIEGFISPQKLGKLVSTLNELEKKHVMPASPKRERRFERIGVTIYDFGGIRIETEEIISERYLDLLGAKGLFDTQKSSFRVPPDPQLLDFQNPLVVSDIIISSNRVDDRDRVERILLGLGVLVSTGGPPTVSRPGVGVVNILDEPVKHTIVDLTRERNFRRLMEIIKGES